MEKFQILVIEDDNDVNHLLCSILKKYDVIPAFSGTEGKLWMSQKEFDLVLLDLMLPGMTGEDLLLDMRSSGFRMPVIVISAKQELEDRVFVLKAGADDFILKPFEVSEVQARVQAALRRWVQVKELLSHKSLGSNQTDRLCYKGLELNRETAEVLLDGKAVLLTAREFDILELLMRHPKKVFTRENIFSTVWNNEYYGEDNTVNVHISNIRNKLARLNAEEEFIKTVWGIGFKMAE